MNSSVIKGGFCLFEFDNSYSYYVNKTLNILLTDHTTNNNILLLSNSYPGVSFNSQITNDILNTIKLCPRYLKSKSIKKERKKNKAEVFTPTWLCNHMINLYDEMWFDKKDVFNIGNDDSKSWGKTDRVIFPNEKNITWKDYIDLVCLEMTCGEAPFLTSRYDTVCGETIALETRIGILDRKLRVVNENITGYNEWLKWAKKSFQNVYGYEYQGDNLLIARINLLLTFIEYYFDRFGENPSLSLVKDIAKIISYNVIQMDGLTYKIPTTEMYAKIKDWKNNSLLYFKDIGEEK